jgi:hypothetical protein
VPSIKDIERAAQIALDDVCKEDPSGERFYCVPLTERVYFSLRDVGFKDSDLFRPMRGHIWVGVGNYIVDLFEPTSKYQIKIFHYQDPIIHRKKSSYEWPGKGEGVRPSDVWKKFPYEDVEDFYNRFY